MHILHINSHNEANKIDQFVKKGADVFILVYMEGCGPCNATRPEWAKLETALKEQYAKNNNLAVIDVNKDFIGKNNYIGSIDGFPTMKHISQHGKKIESYENSNISKKDRSVDSFINWIESKITSPISTSSPEDVLARLKPHYRIKTKRKTKRKHNTFKGKQKTKRYKGGKRKRR